jgi:hypothetical protein
VEKQKALKLNLVAGSKGVYHFWNDFPFYFFLRITTK